MMNDPQKSDGCIVAMKSANKPEGAGAELMERRRPAEGNADESCTHRTLSRGRVSRDLTAYESAKNAFSSNTQGGSRVP